MHHFTRDGGVANRELRLGIGVLAGERRTAGRLHEEVHGNTGHYQRAGDDRAANRGVVVTQRKHSGERYRSRTLVTRCVVLYDEVMTASDPWKRYLDAGMELTSLTRKRAEKAVKDLVKAGAIRSEQAQERVEDLMARSRAASEGLVETVRVEVTRQLQTLGLVEPTKKAAAGTKKASGTAKKTVRGTATKASGAAKKSTATAKKAAGATKKKATGQS